MTPGEVGGTTDGRRDGRSRQQVSTQTTTMVIFVLLIVAAFVVVTYLSRFFFGRAIRNLISEFRRRGATSPEKAVMPEEIGIIRMSPFNKMFRMRDYRPQALRVMGQANVVRVTAEGRLYLSEAELEHSPVKGFARLK
jgi:c-di-AMP phosphodiesterase-like protein